MTNTTNIQAHYRRIKEPYIQTITVIHKHAFLKGVAHRCHINAYSEVFERVVTPGPQQRGEPQDAVEERSIHLT